MTTNRTLMHKLLWVLVPYNGLVGVIALVDFVMHPLALSPYAPFEGAAWFRVFCVVITPIYLVLSYLVLRRSPGNLVGLLMLTWSGGAASFGISVEIAPMLYNVVSVLIPVWWACVIFLPFYFPDGKAYPRWIHPILTAFMYIAVLHGVLAQLAQPTLSLANSPANPTYVPAIVGIYTVFTGIFGLAYLPLVVGVFVAPIRRYRRATYKERQQLKWLLFFAVGFTPYLIMYLGASVIYQDMNQIPPLFMAIYNLYLPYIVLFPALAVGNAILRHNLYDIDIIIRRTLVYSILTAILAVIYFGGVIIVQQVLKPLTESSDLAIVVSTLAIAALFTPLRRRVQSVIDQRFYRRKYDAQKTLEGFNTTLRDEVDLNTLETALVGVVQDTMQPTKVALWVRETAQKEVR